MQYFRFNPSSVHPTRRLRSRTLILLAALTLPALGGGGCVEKRVISEKSYAPGQFPEIRRVPSRERERQEGYQPYHSGRSDTVGGSTQWRAQ